MWAEGNQERKLLQLASNEDLLKLEGYLEDKEAKVSLYEFLRNNITFAVDLLMGVKLFPFQHMAVKTMMETDYTLSIWSRGLSKCLEENSLCITDKGLIKVKDVEVGDFVQSKDTMNKVLGKVVNQKQESFSVNLEGGLKSEGLDYHRVLTVNKNLNFEWKFNKNVKSGDFLVVKRGSEDLCEDFSLFERFFSSPFFVRKKCKMFALKKEDLKDWYYFFGLLLGDGCIHKTQILIGSNDKEIIEFLKRFSKKINLNVNTYSANHTTKEFRNVVINSVNLVHFLNYLGFDGAKKAHEKEIPSLITRTSHENIKFLLRGLMDSDGCCMTTKSNGGKNIGLQVVFSSSSFRLIKQFQNLALSLGVFFRINKRLKNPELQKFPNGNFYMARRSWALALSNRKEIDLYYNLIGFGLKRKMKIYENFSSLPRGSRDFSYVIPYAGEFLKKKYNRKTFKFIKNGKKVITALNEKITQLVINDLICASKLEAEDVEKFQELIREDLFFLKVKSVTKSECVTVDLQVENEHNFISDGIINHNSFTAGIYAGLDAMLNQGIQIGILSSSFRQSKQIFQKIEDIANKPEAVLFRQSISKISKGSDQWTMNIGKSRIVCLPLGMGGKLRGFRFNRILIDEFLLMPESIFNEVIVPFLSVVENPHEREKMYNIETKLIEKGEMKEEDRYVWPNNKLVGLSSASYKFEYLYKLYESFDYAISSTDTKSKVSRAIIQMSYDCAPEQLYDKNLIEQAKLTMSQSQFDREFGALFTDDSSGYFKLSKMKNCCIPDGEKPTIEVKGEPGAEYILAFDPSWSQTESSDDFAIQILKVDKESKKSTLVHSYALSGEPLKVHIQYMLYCLDNFNIVAICGDYNGGVQFLQACNESDLFISRDLELRTIDTAFEDPEKYQQDLAQYKMKYNISEKRIVILRKPTSNWIRKANELLQANFDHKRIFFGARAIDQSYKQQISKSIPIESLKFVKSDEATNNQDKAAKMVDLVENQFDMIAKTIDQCALIQITSTAQGTQTFDLPPNLRKQTGPGKARKDSYSALVLGNWMAKIYYDSNSEQIQEVTRTFVPQFVA